jgi:hypothetical protein
MIDFDGLTDDGVALTSSGELCVPGPERSFRQPVLQPQGSDRIKASHNLEGESVTIPFGHEGSQNGLRSIRTSQ